MKDKYIICDGEVIGVNGEKTFKEEWFRFGNIDLKVLVTKCLKDSYGEEYYNFYIITEMFKQEPINNLDIQEPYEVVDKMTEKEILRFMEERAISFYLWYKYNRDYDISSEPQPIFEKDGDGKNE
jgi:hypothetical protein|tara:strand:- start:1688 stop:2062 length:375 start_codon:yes stop_codon:yes gene_type:complete